MVRMLVKKRRESNSSIDRPRRCELQYEYRQRQGWRLKVKDRPQTFVSREGNTIAASHSVASKNENVLKAGRVCFLLEDTTRRR